MSAPPDTQKVRHVSDHAAWRYQERVDQRCWNPQAAVLVDIAHGVARLTAPRWMHVTEPGDFYVLVAADQRAPTRCYLIRDETAVTLVLEPDPAEVETARRHARKGACRRRHAAVRP